MNIRSFRNHFIQILSPFYDQLEAESFFYLALKSKLGLGKLDLALHPDISFSDEEKTFFEELIEKLKKYTPIQYILQKTVFYGLTFNVGPQVLIPRPETEELIDWILETIAQPNVKSDKILDIGTGSGCIAISIAKNVASSQVSAIDVSESALEVATHNAAENQVQVQFLLKDILETTNLEQTFDVIVSNPPYIRELEKEEMKENVLDFEPHLALFVSDENPLVFYQKIAELAKNHLSENGFLFFEINQYLGQQTQEMLRDLGFRNIELRKDIYQNDRMIRCQK